MGELGLGETLGLRFERQEGDGGVMGDRWGLDLVVNLERMGMRQCKLEQTN